MSAVTETTGQGSTDKHKFKAKLRASETYSFLRLRGIVDEDNNLTGLIPRLTGDVLVVDTAAITRISSCGVRDWVNWLNEVEKHGFKVVLIRCSPPIVTQINMVTNFVGNSVVYSFLAPYYCPTCDRESQKLLEVEPLAQNNPVRAPSFRCSDCGGALDFDDLEESYFAFINGTDTRQLDSRVRRLVEELSPDLEAKIRALNESGSVPLSGPLHTIGSLGDQVGKPDEAALPPNYLDIEEEITGAHKAVKSPTPSAMNTLKENEKEGEGGSSKLMIAFIALAVVVIGLLVYFAVSGV
jgi:hypothetical protein